jgi:hypothetical protein
MNANYFRKLVTDEMCETLMWSGLSLNYKGMKSKEVDSKGKSYYRLKMTVGEVKIYSPKVIYINEHKCHSMNEAKRHLENRYMLI